MLHLNHIASSENYNEDLEDRLMMLVSNQHIGNIDQIYSELDQHRDQVLDM